MHRDPGGSGGLGVLLRRVHRRHASPAGAFFSVTVPIDSKVKAAIAAIPDSAWTPIRYPRAVWDDQLRRWVSDAQVAEVAYTAFASKKGKAITARLIVRRVKDLNREAAAAGQHELFCAWRYHAVFTDSPFATLQAEEHHRDHAQVEQVFADLADGPLADLPSGSFPAKRPGWPAPPSAITCCAPPGPWPASPAPGPGPRRCAATSIGVAARIARHGRGEITLHLPRDWHRETEWMNLFETACGSARRRGLTSPDPATAPRSSIGHLAHPMIPGTNPWTSRRKVSGR